MKNYPFLLLILAPFFLFAQETPNDFKYKKKEFGLNATPFIGNFIRVGDIAMEDQVATFTWKSINYKNVGFRLGLGISIENSFITTRNALHFRIGFEKRKLIKDNWWYYWGMDALLNADDIGDRNPSFGSGIGAGPVIGMFYEINDRIFLSTESSLYLIVGDGANISFVPPVSLFFNMRFKKIKRLYKHQLD